MNEESQERPTSHSTDESKKNPSFRLPYLLLFRWLISLLLVINGLFPLYFNLYNWRLLSEMALTDPIFHPAPFVIFAILSVTAGVLLFRSSKWTVALFASHLFGAIAYHLILKGGASLPTVIGWAVEGLILWYIFNEWVHGKLR